MLLIADLPESTRRNLFSLHLQLPNPINITRAETRTTIDGPSETFTGDVVWFPPGAEHWHGATPDNAMSHIAIQEAKDGSVVNWMGKVSNKEYQAKTDE